jgi:hypothetical protein
MGEIKREALHQRWVHSHEEDTPTEMVFRPATFKFPRSRGRTSFELKPDGTLIEHGIGPTDRREVNEGTWTLGDDYLTFQEPSQSGSRRLHIISVENDRMVIKK